MSVEFIGRGDSGAVFDAELPAYRYTLWRRWWFSAPLNKMVAFCGLNPSTATETVDDPTIRRCIRFAKSWNAQGMVMLNLFAFRATDPQAMKQQLDPVGVRNDEALRYVAERCGLLVACWGNHGSHLGRDQAAINLLRKATGGWLYHLGLTKGGCPKHPLYLKSKTVPCLWYGADISDTTRWV